ncbi:unnamed protein product [Paramecium sonneborni]|uniref:Uncharacterized protein n=1 Tax=Paramecium sonneborni TaxID=65129 RepID=A0A8S1RIU7_9CILI|nr:unnamed protein product [Paramecium sonneborni]
MSNILQKMVTKEVKRRQVETRLLNKSQQTLRQLIPDLKSPLKTPQVSTALEQFKNKFTEGKYILQIEQQRKSQLDEVFLRVQLPIKRDLLEVLLQQFETELWRVCNEQNLHYLSDRYLSYQLSNNKFLKHLVQFVDEQKDKAEIALAQLAGKESTILELQNKYTQLQTMFQQLSHHKDDGQTKLSKNESVKRQKELYMENVRLKNEIERIQDKLKQIENQTNVQKLQEQYQELARKSSEKINELLNENQIKEKQIQKLNLHYQNIKSQYNKLENESKAYQTVFEANKQHLDRLIKENEIHTNLMNRYREIACMQREDFEVRLMYYKEELNVASKAKDKLMQLQSKLDRFQIEKSKDIEPLPNNNYEKEKTGLEKFNDLFSNDKTYQRLTYQALQEEKGRIVTRVGHSIVTMEQHFNAQEIQLEKFTIGYCPFINLVEHHKKTLEQEFSGLQYKRPNLQLLVTLRVILDSKWNEMQLKGEKLWSHLAEFTYSHLMNFKVDMQSKSIKKIDQDVHRIDDQIIKFIVDFSNPVFEKNWECITFQEFLNDFTSQDEMYFYLYARNLLFRGPECSHSTAFYEPHHYIPLLQAEFVATHLLSQYETATLQQVKKVFREKAVNKTITKNLFIVDASFVLRILLEFYRVERRNRYKMFKIAFGSRATNISFKQFRVVLISNYPYITDLELATLYREAYSFTGTGVSIDSFYTIASDTAFFVKHLKLQNLTTQPKILNKEFLFEPDTQPFLIVNEAYKRFQAYQNKFEQLLIDFGLEELFAQFKELDNLIQYQFAPLQYNQKSLSQIIEHYMSLFRNINNIICNRLYLQDQIQQGQEFLSKHEEKMKLNKEQNKDAQFYSGDNFNKQYLRRDDFIPDIEILKGQMDCLEHLGSYLESYELLKKRKDYCMIIQAKKIQKFVKKKMNKFYSFVSSLLSAKFKASLKQGK